MKQSCPAGRGFPSCSPTLPRRQGHRIFYQGPAKTYNDAALNRWLHDTFFEGSGLLGLYGISLAEGLLVFLITLPFGVLADVRRFKELKYGRRLKGPIMLTPAQFNRALKADGLGIETSEKVTFPNKKTLLRIPKSAEAKHIQIMGDTGTGKSTLIKQLLPADRRPGRSRYRLRPGRGVHRELLQEGAWGLDSESLGPPLSLLDTIERVAEPRRGENDRGFDVPAARGQAG